MSGRGGQEGGYWEYIEGSLPKIWRTWILNDVFLPQGRYPKNFVLISQLKVCQEGGVKKGGYLEDVEGS